MGVATIAVAVDGPLPIGDAVAAVVLIGGAIVYGDELVEAAKDAWNSLFGSTWYAKAEGEKTATDIISEKKKGAIHGEFPKEMYDKTLKEIEKLAKAGDKVAQKAKKLLTDKRFDKGDNRK